MKTTRPELGLERVLVALEPSARELGMNPNMKGSVALFGVTLLVRPRSHEKNIGARSKKASGPTGTVRSRRRPKEDDTPST
jgi:hypothetical protein